MTHPSRRILVTGAVGQVGNDLVPALRARFGAENVVAAGHRTAPNDALRRGGPFERIDVTDKAALRDAIAHHRIDTVCHLATLLSASGEERPDTAWTVNLLSLKHVLDLGVELGLRQVFWPSSIAVFGPTTPRAATPQRTVLEPTTMYGVTKLAGENLCNYYFRRHGLDVRSIRYPGLVSYRAFSGGGTTDYSVEMFLEAKRHGRYTCFVRADTRLPLLYIDDAIEGTIQLMEADGARLTVRTSYNMAGLTFSAGELAAEIARHVPGFACDYAPDARQAIADSWPQTVDDSVARRDWDWAPKVGLPTLARIMLAGIA
jgi:nucleoside-diphosphate-sugar epimerase